MKPRTVRLAAGALVCALLWGALAPIPPVSSAFGLVAGVLVVATVASLVRPRRDPYDLSLLREVDEQAQIGEVEEPTTEFDSVVCPCCAAVYNRRLPICPRCGSSA